MLGPAVGSRASDGCREWPETRANTSGFKQRISMLPVGLNSAEMSTGSHVEGEPVLLFSEVRRRAREVGGTAATGWRARESLPARRGEPPWRSTLP